MQKDKLPYKTGHEYGIGFQGINRYKYYKINTYIVLTEKGLTFEKMRDDYSNIPFFLWFAVLSILLSLIAVFYSHKGVWFVFILNMCTWMIMFFALLSAHFLGLPWMVLGAFGISLVSSFLLIFLAIASKGTSKPPLISFTFTVVGIIFSFIFP